MSWYVDMGFVDLQQQSRLAMDRMIRELREGSNVTITVVNSTDDRVRFNTLNATGIQFYRDTADANGDGFRTQLIREFPSGTTKIMGTDITALKFSQPVNKTIVVNVTASKSALLRTLSFNLIEKVRLRNE